MDIDRDLDFTTKSNPEFASCDVQSQSFEGGTTAQSELGVRQSRLHFFSSLDAKVADAVKKDAKRVTYTEVEEYIVRRKVDKRILPLVIASGNAHVIPAFNENFGIYNNNQWTVALSIFYVGYCLLEIPANILQRKIGANRFFFMSLTFWGLSSLSIVYAKGYGALLALRILLGIGEAGYYAGIIYYLSFWYKRKEMALRIRSAVMIFVPGLLAFALVRAKTSLLDGSFHLFCFLLWHLNILNTDGNSYSSSIEGIPTIIMAFVLLLFLPSFPFTSTFLSPREKAIAQARLDRDHRPTSHGGMNGWQGLKAVMLDLNSWLLMLIYVGFNIGTATSTYFLPTLINDLGFTALDAQGLTVAPYAFGYFLTIVQALHSDRTRDRGWHVMFSAAVSFVGYIILAVCSQSSVGASYFALFFVIGGNFSLFPLVMSWAANILSPTTKRGVGTAFIVSVSNCVSIAAPQIYFDPEDQFRRAHGIAAGCLFITFGVAFILRTRLAILNRNKDAALASMTDREKAALGDLGAVNELEDLDLRFRYMT
ncbi:MFS general substrate transporter [Ramaria rubella]|nr:MFS general substrate transporter [Ramaria rubella]